MAKLKAPLFSLGASGQLGKALVFFGWKGLNVVREHVVPSNPKTTLQNTQRSYMTTMVNHIHTAQGHATRPLIAIDTAAYALLGSTYPTPRTWFNQAVKIGIDMLVLALKSSVYRGAVIAQGATAIELEVGLQSSGTPTTLTIHWGTSKTALINSAAGSIIGGPLYKGVCTGLTSGVKYYFQIRMTAPANCVGMNSGIYHATKT